MGHWGYVFGTSAGQVGPDSAPHTGIGARRHSVQEPGSLLSDRARYLVGAVIHVRLGLGMVLLAAVVVGCQEIEAPVATEEPCPADTVWTVQTTEPVHDVPQMPQEVVHSTTTAIPFIPPDTTGG